jgi:hypothetical protein
MNVLLALALLLQETPEAAFKKIEAGVENARSMKVLFTLTAASEADVVNRGSFSFEGESKATLAADLKMKTGERVVISTEFDGKRIRSAFGGHEVSLACDGRAARSNFNMYMSRLGLFAGAVFEHGFWTGANSRRPDSPVTIDLKQMFGVAKLVDLGEGKAGTRVIGYEYAAAFKPNPFLSSKVWYDLRTYQIRRRESRWELKGREELIIEEYEYQADGAAGAGGKTPTPAAPALSEAEQDVRFIQARLQVANEHLKNGRKQKAIDVLEDVILSFPKHALIPEVQRLLEAAKQK